MDDNKTLYFLMFWDFQGVCLLRGSEQRARLDTARSGAPEPETLNFICPNPEP